MLSVLSAQHDSASIQAVEMTEDYLLLFCRLGVTLVHPNAWLLYNKYRYNPCICYKFQELCVNVFVSA